MREHHVDEAIISKIKFGKSSFYKSELPGRFPTLAPGEWFALVGKHEKFLACGHSLQTDSPNVYILGQDIDTPEDYIKKRLQLAQKRRARFYKGEDCRLVFGINDGLPGVVIDQYSTHVLIQINTLAMDQYREQLKSALQNMYPDKNVILFDQEKYRRVEMLPEYSKSWDDEEILRVIDSGFEYHIALKDVQKIGFYFDHRDNRKKFERFAKEYFQKERWETLDLFSYLGAWGRHAARAGSTSIELVDQADYSNVISSSDEFKFIRADVFKFLDEAQAKRQKWHCIVADPPAFCKTAKKKNEAKQGYHNLFKKIFPLLHPDSILVAASCTKYINHIELSEIVQDEARKHKRKIVMRDIGIQGQDHPIESLSDSSNYIKYFLYTVE